MKKILLFILIFIFLFAAFIAFDLWSAKKNLTATKEALLTADFEKAQVLSRRSLSSLGRAHYFVNILFIEDSIKTGENLSKIAFHLSKAGKSLEEIINLVFGKSVGNLELLTQEAKAELDSAWEKTALLEADLKKKPVIEIGSLLEKIKISRDFMIILPELLGANGKRSYLILIQNNMELRPTGGFIGSYALVVFKKGLLLDFKVEDVYTADGQLRGHVEPPEPIKKYLGEAGWYLRDSNFDPDFPQSAKKAAWFFQKETGLIVDGVIGVNLSVAQKILEAIGPVHLPDYQETITAENLFEKASYHSEVNFFPGSTQKKDFLNSLTNQIFYQIKETNNWIKVGQALLQCLEEKQIIIFSNNADVMKKIVQFNWHGGLLPNQELTDYLMIAESNFGINKVNHFIQRKIDYRLTIQKDSLKKKLIICYFNKSPVQTWPGGGYKNYLRVYVPQYNQLEEIKINDRVLNLEKIDISSVLNKTVFGFLVEVPAGEEKKVTFSYSSPFQTFKTFTYSLLVQKQSGTLRDPLVVLIQYPSFLKATRFLPQALTGPQSILYNTNLLKDRFFSIEFIQ